MMVKPERPHWHPLPAVAQAIADGDPWLLAWALLSATPYRKLSDESGIADSRLDELYLGSPVTGAELTALAKAWHADINEVRLTIPANMLAG